MRDGIRDAGIRRRVPGAVQVSLVIPIKDEIDTIVELADRIDAVMKRQGGGYELLFVDDGSADGSWETMVRLAARPEVRAIRNRRNLGKATSLHHGISEAQGSVIITMDGDLQDDPDEIPRFLGAIGSGYDVVSGWKRTRRDPASKRLPSLLFNRVARGVSGVELNDFNCGFKAYTQEAARALLPSLYGDMHRYLPVFLGSQGFKVGEIEVRHHPRRFGRSKYGLSRMNAGLWDIITVTLLTRFRYRPLHAFGAGALAVAALGAAAGGALILLGGPLPALTIALFAALTATVLLGAGLIAELVVYSLGPTEPKESVVALAEGDAAGRRDGGDERANSDGRARAA